MKFDIDFKLLKKLLFECRVFLITVFILCALVGAFFSIKNSFIYVAKTSLIFGRIKPEEQIVSNIVQTNPSAEQFETNEDNPEGISTENTEVVAPQTNNIKPEQNVSLTNVNIDSNTLKTCQTLIKSDNLIAKLKEKLNIEDSAKDIKKSLSISRLQGSNVLMITAEGSTAEKACDIANGMAQVFSDEVKVIYNLDSVYIIDSVDYKDAEKTGFNYAYLVLWIFLAIVINVVFLAIKQLKIIDSTVEDIRLYIKSKIKSIREFISSKFHKEEIKELPSGEELDENYKVISNKSIVDSDFVPSEEPKIDTIISTNIEEFNSKTELFDDYASNIPISDEKEKTSAKPEENESKTIPTKKEKTKKTLQKDTIPAKEEPVVEKKITKKIGKEEAMSIKAQEELIALREENNQKLRDERNKFESQAQIQKRLNDEIEARKKLESELENQKKTLQEERKAMEEKIRKEIQKQLIEEQRMMQEEEERMAFEIELKEQEEEQRIMEEERLRMLREKEERKEKQKQERIEKRIIRAEIRKQKAEERAKQRAIANEERARRQAIKKEEKIKLYNQREAERQEILRKYYEEKNNKKAIEELENNSNYNEYQPSMNVETSSDEIKMNNYSTIEHIKEKPVKRKELSEDFIQDNLYPKFKL